MATCSKCGKQEAEFAVGPSLLCDDCTTDSADVIVSKGWKIKPLRKAAKALREARKLERALDGASRSVQGVATQTGARPPSLSGGGHALDGSGCSANPEQQGPGVIPGRDNEGETAGDVKPDDVEEPGVCSPTA